MDRSNGITLGMGINIKLTLVQADPYICGHKGHFQTSCGLTFSKCYELYDTIGKCEGNGMGPGIM